MESGNNDGSDGAPSALLSKSQGNKVGQREYLADPETFQKSDSARWKMHSRIRTRLRQTIYDFALVYQNWDRLNLGNAFDEENVHMRGMRDGAEGTIATLYRALSDTQIPFGSHLEGSIVQAELDMNDRLVDVRFSVTPKAIDEVSVDNSAERVNPEEVDTLRIPEMRAILEGLAHSDEDISELVAEGYQNARLKRAGKD